MVSLAGQRACVMVCIHMVMLLCSVASYKDAHAVRMMKDGALSITVPSGISR